MAVKLGVSDKNRFTPYDWPMIQTHYSDLKLYEGSSVRDSSQQHFWVQMGYHGAQSSSGASANSWVTNVDITGCGQLGFVIGWCAGGASSTHTFRITVDGVVYERSIVMIDSSGGTTDWHYDRPYLGNGIICEDLIYRSGVMHPGRFPAYNTKLWTSHTNSSKYDSFVSTNQMLIHPTHSIMQDGLPTVPFRESLKVEQKNSVGFYNSGYYGYSGCSYMITG